jgi:hypothetical protein
MNYELKVSITNNKAGKFHYQVIDENGIIISERKSNREYVACTINGGFYFGRLDLIGKGENGRFIKDRIQSLNMTEEQFKKKFPIDIYPIFHNQYDEYIADAKKDLKIYTTIAYKK